MKILFLITSFASKVKYHPGIASLSSFLKEDGHETNLITVNSKNRNNYTQQIRLYKPNVIAVSSNTHQFTYVKKIIKELKNEFPEIKIILGGFHAILTDNLIVEIPELDAVCKGEGEEPLLSYVNSLSEGKQPTAIQNLDIRTDNEIENNSVTYYVKDLDSLPFPDYTIFPQFNGALEFPARFLFNRGCPFDCTYCCNHEFKNRFPEKKNYVRFKNPERIIGELLFFSRQFFFKHYVIDDDIFTLKKTWLLKFCELYPEELISSKTFEINVRVGTVDEEMLKALKNIGCILIKIGLESGSEKIRENVLNRKILNKEIMNTGELIKSVGIQLHTFNMLGIPGESRFDVLKTIKLNRNLQPDKAQLTVFYPYSNTVLGDYCYKNKLLRKSFSDSYFSESILKFPFIKISKIEILFFINFFYFFVFYNKFNFYSLFKKSLKNFLLQIAITLKKSILKR